MCIVNVCAHKVLLKRNATTIYSYINSYCVVHCNVDSDLDACVMP